MYYMGLGFVVKIGFLKSYYAVLRSFVPCYSVMFDTLILPGNDAVEDFLFGGIDMSHIETKRLMLRPLTESDIKAVRLVGGDEFKTDEAALKFIRWQQSPGRLLIQFYIWLKKTDQCIGRVYIHAKPEIDDEVEIGYSILEKHRRKGYATEAARAAVWFAFEQAGQEVLCAIVKPENIASRKVIEKVGFIHGGTRIVKDDDGVDRTFRYFRLYHTDFLPGPEWEAGNICQPESMAAFFNSRADGYNHHMLRGSGEEDYQKLGSCFPKTDEAIHILDIGCGTGIELDYIWQQAPNAHFTCVDMSQGMLELLLKNHCANRDKISIIQASYTDWEYPEETFDFVVSSMTMHHLWENEKTAVYRKILAALKNEGSYIESDFIVNPILSEQYRKRYEMITAALTEKAKAGEYHIDIPFTAEMQKKLLQDAGFSFIEVLDSSINNGNGAILRTRKRGQPS